jgi:hypothetical protein
MEKGRESGTSPAAYPIFLIQAKKQVESAIEPGICGR